MSNNQLSSLELYLFPACPYAQRAHMNLIHSQLAFEKRVISPMDMPDNFLSLSPLGNVPVLIVDETQSIFESSIIADYIAQISPISLEPEDEVIRAQMRAWSEYSEACMGAMMAMLNAADEASMIEANKTFISKFDILSTQLTALGNDAGPYFFGEQYTTIDSTYGPLFLRMKTLGDIFPSFSLDGLPTNIQQWMNALCASETLQQSIVGEFTQVYKMFINNKASDGFINQQLQN